MKTVLLVIPPSNTTKVADVSRDKFYGVSLGDEKGFIIRPQFEVGPYRIAAIDAMTRGNGWNHFQTGSLSEAIESILRDNSRNCVFEFDTAQELFAWLAQK